MLVLNDLLGLGDGRVPKFVRACAALRARTLKAADEFSTDIRARSFPSVAEEYGMSAAALAECKEKFN